MSLKIDISGFNLSNPPVTVAGGKAASYLFSSTNTLTVGQTTQVSKSLFDGAIDIQYFPPVILEPSGFTQFQIAVPDASQSVTPRSGSHTWQAQLYGVGDLLPNGIVAVLPSIASWFVPPPSTLSNIIEVDSGTSKIKYPITSVSSCTGAGAAVDPNKTLGIACDIPGCVACGEPINIGTGNVFERVTDYHTAGFNQLAFHRYYNSLAGSTTYAVRLGNNWRSNYDRYLRLSATSVVAERADGRQITFNLANGAWTGDSDVDYKLTNSGSTWTLTDPNDAVENYSVVNSNEGLLQSIRARNGYTQTLQYDSGSQLATVTDSFNRQLSLTYTAGRLNTLTTPDGLILTYGYTAGNLTSVSYNTTPVSSQTYLYENAGMPALLTGIVDEDGNRYVTWTYDSKGRGLSSQFSGGAGLMKISYNDTDGSRTVTNALGAQTVYKFTTLQNISKVTEIDLPATAGAPAGISKITYDANGYYASRTDWNGVPTNYTNDVHGRPTTIVEAAGTPQARTTTVTYHPTFHLPLKFVEEGVTTTYTYDSAGNPLTRTVADTTTTTVPYSTSGQTRTWTYTWSNLLPASIQKPRTDVATLTKFTYDPSGALTAVTNALGQTTRITRHLPGGLPETIVDPAGVETQLTYDVRLRMVSSAVNTAAGPLTTSFRYDAVGNRIGTTLPDGSSLTSVYDAAHRLTGITDLFNQSTTVVLDALGDRTNASLLDSAGNIQRTGSGQFDALGRLLQDVGGAGQITAYSYDANGNPRTVTDPLNRVTQRTFDALNRTTRVTDPAKGVTTTVYDAHDRRTSVTDPNGGITRYVYDGFGDLIQRVSPDSGVTVYRYDADGNLTQTTDATGAVTNHTYDALGRVLTTTYPADPAENVTSTYDQATAGFGIGRLTGVADAAGVLNRSYDERGNLLSETRVAGSVTLVTTYTYDFANRVSSIVYPSGWTVTYTRDQMGRTTAIGAQPPDGSVGISVLDNVAYQPFGPVSALAFGNGVTETRSFDRDYRVTNLSDAGAVALQNLTYNYDAAGNVTAIVDGVSSANSQTFNYDVLNRLIAATGGYGGFEYTYDILGNRLTLSQAGSTTSYSYAPRTNQLAAVSAGGVDQSIGYSKTGHVSNFNPAAGALTNLTYNQAGRLATVMAGDNPAAQYTYDTFGQRLVKTGATTTLYQYDQGGRLLEEIDGEGHTLASYIYLDDLPVATLSPGTGQIYYLHADRLGAPQTATDSSQNVVWIGNYGPFGEMSNAPGLIVQNLRLPGQEFDADTGLYHNGFRDYAPGWGRYLQSDPIGLIGGLNTYTYVGANPVNRTDPRGLDWRNDAQNQWNELKVTVAEDVDAAEKQLNKLGAFGSQVISEAKGCLLSLDKKWEDFKKTDDYKELHETWLTIKAGIAVIGEDFLGLLSIVPAAFQTLCPSSCLDKQLFPGPECPQKCKQPIR